MSTVGWGVEGWAIERLFIFNSTAFYPPTEQIIIWYLNAVISPPHLGWSWGVQGKVKTALEQGLQFRQHVINF